LKNGGCGGGFEMDDNLIKKILEESKTIAVVGLSPKEDRPSHKVAEYLQAQGYKIIPVNPECDEILGEKCFATLKEVPVKVDVVDIFRRPEFIPPIVEEAIAIGAKVIWMQLGIINEEAAAKAKEAGLEVVMDRCMKIEHKKLLGA